MIELPKTRVEIQAVGSSQTERAATIIALLEGVPIVVYRKDGSVFAVMRPHDSAASSLEQDNEHLSKFTQGEDTC